MKGTIYVDTLVLHFRRCLRVRFTYSGTGGNAKLLLDTLSGLGLFKYMWQIHFCA
jgi:hypothetical protein